MRHRPLGKTGMQVSPLCLGAMMFGAWGNTDHDDSIRDHPPRPRRRDQLRRHRRRVLRRRVGGDRRQGARRRRDVTTSILATKAHGAMGRDRNMRGNSRRWLVREVESSLRRLQTDWIDLYQIHRPDPDTEHEETLSALTDLVRAGKIRAFGSSTYPAHQIVDAQWIARDRGLGRFVTEQPPYSMLVRGIERDVLPVAAAVRHGRAAVEPARRRLAERSVPPRPGAADHAPLRPDAAALRPVARAENQLKLERADALAVLAEQHGMTLVDMAVAFVLAHPAVSSAIIGPRTMEQLESQLGAADIDAVGGGARRDRRDRAAGHQLVAERRRLRAAGAHRREPAPPGPLRSRPRQVNVSGGPPRPDISRAEASITSRGSSRSATISASASAPTTYRCSGRRLSTAVTIASRDRIRRGREAAAAAHDRRGLLVRRAVGRRRIGRPWTDRGLRLRLDPGLEEPGLDDRHPDAEPGDLHPQHVGQAPRGRTSRRGTSR